jgi:hypothetical protein
MHSAHFQTRVVLIYGTVTIPTITPTVNEAQATTVITQPAYNTIDY